MEFTQILTRKTSLRKNVADLAVSELEKVAENLLDIIEEKKAVEASEIEAQAAQQAKIEGLKQAIAEAGLSIDEVMSSFENVKKPKKTVKPKYRLSDEEGEICEWTGRGRTPKIFAAYIESGGSLDDLLI